MNPTRTKAALLLIPGKLDMTPAVKDAQTARAIATKRGFIAFFFDPRINRLYGKLKETK